MKDVKTGSIKRFGFRVERCESSISQMSHLSLKKVSGSSGNVSGIYLIFHE